MLTASQKVPPSDVHMACVYVINLIVIKEKLKSIRTYMEGKHVGYLE